MQLSTYRGDIVAVAGATRAYLAPNIEALEDHDPVKQFVRELCLYAHRLAQGALGEEPPRYLPARAQQVRARGADARSRPDAQAQLSSITVTPEAPEADTRTEPLGVPTLDASSHATGKMASR
jgi:hypothetical protein